MTLELSGLKKVRERIAKLDVESKEDAKDPNPSDLGLSLEWRRDGEILGLKHSVEQFQSDLRAIEAELRKIIIDGVAYSTRIDNVIRAIHSAIEEKR